MTKAPVAAGRGRKHAPSVISAQPPPKERAPELDPALGARSTSQQYITHSFNDRTLYWQTGHPQGVRCERC